MEPQYIQGFSNFFANSCRLREVQRDRKRIRSGSRSGHPSMASSNDILSLMSSANVAIMNMARRMTDLSNENETLKRENIEMQEKVASLTDANASLVEDLGVALAENKNLKVTIGGLKSRRCLMPKNAVRVWISSP
jgi:hypothetical protein